MPIEVVTAIIAAVSVAVGAITGGVVSLLTEWWRGNRETIKRQAERAAARDDLQRAVLIELQDASLLWLRGMSRIETMVKAAAQSHKPWNVEEQGKSDPQGVLLEVDARAKTIALAERIRNDATRSQVKAFVQAGLAVVFETTSYVQFTQNYSAYLTAWRTSDEAVGMEMRRFL